MLSSRYHIYNYIIKNSLSFVMGEIASVEQLIDATYVIRIVLKTDEKIRERGYAMASDYKEVVNSSRTTMDVARGLRDFGLVTIEQEGKRAYKILLTEKGKELATHLRRAVEVFNEAAEGSSDRTGST